MTPTGVPVPGERTPDADDPRGVVARIMDAVPPGSYLTVGDTTTDIDSQRVAAATAAC